MPAVALVRHGAEQHRSFDYVGLGDFSAALFADLWVRGQRPDECGEPLLAPWPCFDASVCPAGCIWVVTGVGGFAGALGGPVELVASWYYLGVHQGPRQRRISVVQKAFAASFEARRGGRAPTKATTNEPLSTVVQATEPTAELFITGESEKQLPPTRSSAPSSLVSRTWCRVARLRV
ncbi:MAG: hypothetical protein LBU38_01230 [Propionibacteriaceae bacterium]|nr:hypothetical protein [Propionibacteriaceae bacterium]